MEIGNRKFVFNDPDLPTLFVRLSLTYSIKLFTRDTFETRTKHANFIDINSLDFRGPFRPGFGKNYPAVCSYIRNIFSHKLSLTYNGGSEEIGVSDRSGKIRQLSKRPDLTVSCPKKKVWPY